MKAASGKIAVEDADAAAFLNRHRANKMDQSSSRTIHTSLFNERSGIESDLTAVTSARVNPAIRKCLIKCFEDARRDPFETLGIIWNGRTRLRPVTDDDPMIVDLLARLDAVALP